MNVALHIILFRLGSNNIFGLVQTTADGANRYQRPFGVGQTEAPPQFGQCSVSMSIFPELTQYWIFFRLAPQID
jgi:hypothetical protein